MTMMPSDWNEIEAAYQAMHAILPPSTEPEA